MDKEKSKTVTEGSGDQRQVKTVKVGAADLLAFCDPRYALSQVTVHF